MSYSNSCSRIKLIRGWSSSPQRITQAASVPRAIVMPMRCSMPLCRYNGRASRNLAVTIQASKPGEALLLGIGCSGAAAVLTWASQQGQAYFLRIWRMTRILAGMISNCSETSSAMTFRSCPSGQWRCSSGNSWMTSTRGNSGGSACRPLFLALAAPPGADRVSSVSSTGISSASTSASLNRSCWSG